MSKTRFGAWRAWGSAAVAVSCTVWSAQAHADDVVGHLMREGHLRRRSASAITTKVSRNMTANAARGGNDYDRVRQAIGVALFGASGAGGTLEEYNERLAQVLSKLEGGLDLWSLSALFGADSVASCRQDFGLKKPDCRALASAASVAPTIDVDGLLAEARSAFQSGNYSRAAEAYEQVTTARPSEAAAFAGLGQSRIRIGDGRGAVQALRTAVGLAPNVANLRAYLGRALMTAGDRAGATTAFREALAINASHADAKAGLRELESAPPPVAAPRPTVVASTNAPSATPRFGTPRFGTPRPPTSSPHAAPSTAAPSGARFGSGSTSGATFGGARTASGGSNPVAIQWVQKGDAHLQARQFTQALSAYQMGASFDPNSAAAFAGIGAASMGTGDRAGAARALQTAVRLAPESADYHAALGNALAASGDTETATAAYRRALSVAPGHRAATAGLAQLEGGGSAAPTVVAAVVPAPLPQPRVVPAPQSAPPAPVVRAPAAVVPVVAVADEPEPEPVAVAEPEPVVAEPTVEEDDLIAGLLSDPLGPTNARPRSGGARPNASAAAPPAAASPTPAPASTAGLPQSPSREQVAEVMRGLLPTVKACLPEQTGVVAVQMTITGATGEVAEAAVVGRDADDPEAICVAEVVRGGTFPHFAKAKLSIKFPFQL